MTRTVTLTLHLEQLDSGDYSWWVDSPDEAGLYSAGDSLAEALSLAIEALHIDHGPEVMVRLRAGTHGADAGFINRSDLALRIPQIA